MTAQQPGRSKSPIPSGLFAFTFALMGPACGINAAMIAVAIPATAPFGLPGLVAAGAVGAIIGILPARWLARKIHEGLSDD